MNPSAQTTSAKIASTSDVRLPRPSGSGNVAESVAKCCHLAMPWVIISVPKTMRAASSSHEVPAPEGVAGKISRRIAFMFLFCS